MPKQRKHLPEPEPTRQTPPTRKHTPAKPTPQGTKTQIKAKPHSTKALPFKKPRDLNF